MIRHIFALSLTLALLAPSAWAQRSVQAQLQVLQTEPTVRQVQEAALRYFRVNADTVSSMRSRAGLEALLPVIEVSGGYSKSNKDEDTFNFEFSDTDVWVQKGGGGDAYDIKGKAVWNLPQLVFNAEELDVASLAGLMEGLLKESTRLYFMRRRLQVDMILNPPTDQASLLSKQLRLEELTGLLDAMTGGWFQKALENKGRRSKRSPSSRTNAPAAAAMPPAPARTPRVQRASAPTTVLTKPAPQPVVTPSGAEPTK